ncbi:helix-turn-helix transcriptional regulator [Azospirillum picis]|uniref:AraC-like DNA-binding protein n=1 Tax=Azospirillum picis TaxID=488438 RepID=A0ABU0MS29_9PROT|nr:AraC family transcriptional regulator [Azospirillum picis]MBP2302631.1 AraC-like DNA-binding protein [Azospirillum picis]MDQ0536292.1 AraC-like DNA-binding protein [Azospirillum picis]
MELALSETPPRLPSALAGQASVSWMPEDGMPEEANRLSAAVDRLLRVASDMLASDNQSIADCLSLALARLQRPGGDPGTDAKAPEEAGRKTGLAAWQVRRVVSHVDAHLAGTIRNRDLAAAAKLSCGYFCQAFKDSFGCPPHAYIMRRRVERAKELLETTGTPLSQIALDCGFSDQSHFSRIFRRIAGEVPRLWRHKRQMDGLEPAPAAVDV